MGSVKLLGGLDLQERAGSTSWGSALASHFSLNVARLPVGCLLLALAPRLSTDALPARS